MENMVLVKCGMDTSMDFTSPKTNRPVLQKSGKKHDLRIKNYNNKITHVNSEFPQGMPLDIILL